MAAKREIAYIGKMLDGCDSIDICRVVDMDMVTGACLVYNRTTQKMDIVRQLDRYELSDKMKRDIRDSEKMYQLPNCASLIRDGAWKLLI